MSNDLPLTITIPVPTPRPRARGIHSTGRYGTNLRVRCTFEDRDMIQKACEHLGIEESAFLRWTSVYAAKAILDVVTANIEETDNERS
jgi:hypothetical protein